MLSKYVYHRIFQSSEWEWRRAAAAHWARWSFRCFCDQVELTWTASKVVIDFVRRS